MSRLERGAVLLDANRAAVAGTWVRIGQAFHDFNLSRTGVRIAQNHRHLDVGITRWDVADVVKDFSSVVVSLVVLVGSDINTAARDDEL